MEDIKITEEPFAKFINKAKKKLNKKTEEEPKQELPKTIVGDYSYIKSNRKQELLSFKKRVLELIQKEPDCTSPIMQLIDKQVYSNLTESEKQAYIFKLSKDYTTIIKEIKQ